MKIKKRTYRFCVLCLCGLYLLVDARIILEQIYKIKGEKLWTASSDLA